MLFMALICHVFVEMSLLDFGAENSIRISHGISYPSGINVIALLQRPRTAGSLMRIISPERSKHAK